MLTVEICISDEERCNDLSVRIEELLIDDYGFRYDTPVDEVWNESYIPLVNEERNEAVTIYLD